MIRPIYLYGQSVLREVAEEVVEKDKVLKDLIRDLFDTMDNSDGVGLAGPQIGVSRRLFVTDAQSFISGVPAEERPLIKQFRKVFINPIIESEQGASVGYEEGCLSIPGLRQEVFRLSTIKVSYLDADMIPQEEVLDGIRARIFQHELDHLDGVLFVDHLSSLQRSLLKKSLEKIRLGKVEASYPVQALKG